jgi:beta-phosphoglucomutase
MHWLDQYQLFLFDFDGLLVNTEEIHFLAYKKMLAARGISLNWSFARYCQAAHYEAEALRIQLYDAFPQLQKQEPNWSVLYAEKKKALQHLYETGAVQLMAGAEKLLQQLHSKKAKRCVVTHSPDELVNLIRKQLPILNTIENWVTREQYGQPKPHSECYLKAIELFAKPSDKIIGFEDTPRGLRALSGTRAQPVIVCEIDYPELPSFIKSGAWHFPSFEQALVHN